MRSKKFLFERICRIVRSNRFYSLFFFAAFLSVLLLKGNVAFSAFQTKTQNFVVTAETEVLSQKVAQSAEESRRRLAKLWLGTELQPWASPCPIQVKCGPEMGAGGETVFTFDNNSVSGWKMSVQGTEERILDSVIPHEVSHTVLATYFCRPVPRWIDEGAATSIEADIERNNYRTMLVGFLKDYRGIPFNTMVRLSEYPSDMLPFYSQGFSVCEYLIAIGGHRRLIEFARKGIETGDWSAAVRQCYNFQDLSDLQIKWTNWISEWHNKGHLSQLPEVVKMADYPYDINGRLISETTLASADTSSSTLNSSIAMNGNLTPQALRPANPLNSFVAFPQTGIPVNTEENISFDAGVGTTLPVNQVASAFSSSLNGADSMNMEYQGSYGHREIFSSGEDRINLGGSPRILGQSPR